MTYPILTFLVTAGLALGQTALPAKPAVPKQGEVPPETVVMKVGEKSITAAELNKLVSTFSKEVQTQAARDPKQVMQSYFLMQSLAKEAVEQKLDQTSPTKETLELQRLQTLASALISQHGASIAVSDEDARKRYEAGRDQRYQQARIRAIVIKYADAGIVQTAINMSDPKAPKPEPASLLPTENEARTKAVGIVKQARNGGDFAELAKKLSDDQQTGANGGLFPPLRLADRIPDGIKNVVFTMKPGEISDPVRQPLGFYVIKLEERGAMPFDDAKPGIVNEIKQERFEKWMAEVRKPFEVTIESPEFFGMTPPKPAEGAAPAGPAK